MMNAPAPPPDPNREPQEIRDLLSQRQREQEAARQQGGRRVVLNKETGKLVIQYDDETQEQAQPPEPNQSEVLPLPRVGEWA